MYLTITFTNIIYQSSYPPISLSIYLHSHMWTLYDEVLITINNHLPLSFYLLSVRLNVCVSVSRHRPLPPPTEPGLLPPCSANRKLGWPGYASPRRAAPTPSCRASAAVCWTSCWSSRWETPPLLFHGTLVFSGLQLHTRENKGNIIIQTWYKTEEKSIFRYMCQNWWSTTRCRVIEESCVTQGLWIPGGGV
jgi:hypothetical protein